MFGQKYIFDIYCDLHPSGTCGNWWWYPWVSGQSACVRVSSCEVFLEVQWIGWMGCVLNGWRWHNLLGQWLGSWAGGWLRLAVLTWVGGHNGGDAVGCESVAGQVDGELALCGLGSWVPGQSRWTRLVAEPVDWTKSVAGTMEPVVGSFGGGRRYVGWATRLIRWSRVVVPLRCAGSESRCVGPVWGGFSGWQLAGRLTRLKLGGGPWSVAMVDLWLG
ncbi:hypothetical protein TIFTF001_034564 [Ficus carica]|uniref:Uncharacterized protein n=1 Tax=Ficus carica TaxID=3494 RepID=A0AA88E0R0_FICCA|nr:hypothetical protein TIFTF001_034564 [Ficus carica]